MTKWIRETVWQFTSSATEEYDRQLRHAYETDVRSSPVHAPSWFEAARIYDWDVLWTLPVCEAPKSGPEKFGPAARPKHLCSPVCPSTPAL